MLLHLLVQEALLLIGAYLVRHAQTISLKLMIKLLDWRERLQSYLK